ncbi:hypothetical protein [Arthrobacter sp. CAN_C5]|uniref:hypothetical protein n=1 Tax=Arthrobacter sp. CAN_C5 TaxID=2760706 RepID=UPI001AE8DFFA|nr:hypothetical protein [Arthrobacter sp. CAN_C5]MBP2216327.1 cyanophycin synthetase [Arthrobacter sp. CAN_C5]
MASSISFRDLSVSERRVEVLASTVEDEYDLWFEFSEDIRVTTTSVAVALSTLCGRKYSEIYYDFPVSERVFPAIRELTQAQVAARAATEEIQFHRAGSLLSFSGGFDSLAAKMLMPEDVKLVSMDFGGRFARERESFERWDTLRVSTNLADTPLRQNSWSFMGIGAILAGNHYKAKYHTFGGILEASPDNMRTAPVAARNNTFPPFKAAGYINAPYVLGLTEIGTLAVMLRTEPNLVANSLLSVASPGEEKLYRKSILASVTAGRLGVAVGLPDIPAPAQPHYRFGKIFALDLLSLYVLKHAGSEVAGSLVSGIPNKANLLVDRLDLTFFERANDTLYANFPAKLMGGLARKLVEGGVCFYSKGDWEEFAQVRSFLGQYHPVV